MRNRIALLLVMSVMIFSLAACGKKDEAADQDTASTVVEDQTDDSNEEAVGDMELTDDYPDNFMEERSGQYVYDSYDDVIKNLQSGEAYAYAKVLGADEDVLFIAPETFDGYGNPAAIECYAYIANADGKYECASPFTSGSTATPISISEEGYVLQASHTDVSCLAIDKNTHGFMYVISASVEYDEDGNETYSGFYRDTNDVSSTDHEIAADDSSVFESTFAKFTDDNYIQFTVVK